MYCYHKSITYNTDIAVYSPFSLTFVKGSYKIIVIITYMFMPSPEEILFSMSKYCFRRKYLFSYLLRGVISLPRVLYPWLFSCSECCFLFIKICKNCCFPYNFIIIEFTINPFQFTGEPSCLLGRNQNKQIK